MYFTIRHEEITIQLFSFLKSRLLLDICHINQAETISV